MAGNGWLERARTGGQWSSEEAAEAIAAWQRSGESLAAFARRHGLVAERISYWRRRLEPSVSTSNALVPVTVRAAAPVVMTGAPLVTVTVGAVRLDVEDPGGVAPEWLARVVRVLQGGVG